MMEIDWGEVAELAAEDRARRRHNRRLASHPDPQDPDHPWQDNEGDGDDLSSNGDSDSLGRPCDPVAVRDVLGE